MLGKGLKRFDEWLANLSLPLTIEKGILLSFLIHGILESPSEAGSCVLDPQQAFTAEMLGRFVEHFKRAGYRFVSPDEVAKGLAQSGKYVLLTFDDGYYNNVRALAVLEAFDAPAVFFISSDHVKLGKSFWWDVVYREFKKLGRGDQELDRARAHYKQLRTSEVELDLRLHFGEAALVPVSDLDRPFTASELRTFSRHRLVFLGNHTKDHAILTNYSVAEIQEQICGCQEALREISGKTPQMIAYPNGNYSKEILRASRETGLEVGIVVQPGRNRLPLHVGCRDAMTMKRYTLWGNRPIEAQCRVSRSGLSLHRLMNREKAHMIARQITTDFSGKKGSLANLAGS